MPHGCGSDTEPLRVRFARHSTRGLLLGFSAPRVAVLGAAGIVAVVALFAGGVMALALSAVVCVPLVASAVVRAGGRPVVEWAATAAHYQVRKAGAQTEFRGQAGPAPPRRHPGPPWRRRLFAALPGRGLRGGHGP